MLSGMPGHVVRPGIRHQRPETETQTETETETETQKPSTGPEQQERERGTEGRCAGACKVNDCTANWHTLKIKCIAFVNYINNIRGQFGHGQEVRAVERSDPKRREEKGDDGHAWMMGMPCWRAESVLNGKSLQFFSSVRTFFQLHMAEL